MNDTPIAYADGDIVYCLHCSKTMFPYFDPETLERFNAYGIIVYEVYRDTSGSTPDHSCEVCGHTVSHAA